jgi:hypothetical protein
MFIVKTEGTIASDFKDLAGCKLEVYSLCPDYSKRNGYDLNCSSLILVTTVDY